MNEDGSDQTRLTFNESTTDILTYQLTAQVLPSALTETVIGKYMSCIQMAAIKHD